MFDILEVERTVEGEADITLVPQGREWLNQWLAAKESLRRPGPAAP